MTSSNKMISLYKLMIKGCNYVLNVINILYLLFIGIIIAQSQLTRKQ